MGVNYKVMNDVVWLMAIHTSPVIAVSLGTQAPVRREMKAQT